jgi:insertion element IS1 protein InsB
MAIILVRCPTCKNTHVVKRGTTPQGKQRYYCKTADCPTQTFILEYSYSGCLPEVKEKVIEMAANGSGIRDTARVLNISPTTVIRDLKKRIQP